MFISYQFDYGEELLISPYAQQYDVWSLINEQYLTYIPCHTYATHPLGLSEIDFTIIFFLLMLQNDNKSGQFWERHEDTSANYMLKCA